MTKKKLLLTSIIALVAVAVVGVTVALLSDVTEVVENTFVFGDINIDLDESDIDNDGNTKKNTYTHVMPGKEYTKDPVVTVKENSEACYVFVKLTKTANFDNYFNYSIADGWTALDGETDVYYRTQAATGDTSVSYHVLKDDKVTVKTSVTKNDVEAMANNHPKMTFVAYAVQSDSIDSAADAWAEANK